MIDSKQIQHHMEVVGSDGQHVGTVDNVGIKLTKNDVNANDQHHYLELENVVSVQDNKLVLNIPGSQAVAELKMVEN